MKIKNNFFLMIVSSVLLTSVLFSKEKNYYSTLLVPRFSESYYIDQGLKYFDTLDSFARRDSIPNYSDLVIRWEWYPWLKLTGFKKSTMSYDRLLLLYPTNVIKRDCRAFSVQPFARCRVTFYYLQNEKLVDIYEEFTFNDQGEITFIEAWSDEEKYFPTSDFSDKWAESPDVNRLSTKVPGLGRSDGRIDIRDKIFIDATKKDTDLYDLWIRLNHPVYYWLKEGFRFFGEL